MTQAMTHKTITIHITDTPGGGVTVLTTAECPHPGARLTPAQALATDVLNTCSHRASDVRYWQGADQALALVQELVDPEGYGHAATHDVRRRAFQVLGRTPSSQAAEVQQ